MTGALPFPNLGVPDQQIYNGDCLSVLKQFADGSVDCVVSDPPYQLSSASRARPDQTTSRVTSGFMGKEWDVLPPVETLKEILRVMKPGAFSFWLMTPRQDSYMEFLLRLREAGFVISFSPMVWAYASGFPKASNISKLVDKRLGVEPTIVGQTPYKINTNVQGGKFSVESDNKKEGYVTGNITSPTSEEAKKFEGAYGGFQPKPAVEMIIVAMKPLSEKTYVEQALANGKGITWLDDCRIPFRSTDDIIAKNPHTQSKGTEAYDTHCYGTYAPVKVPYVGSELEGRFPANLLVSDSILNDGVKRNQGHWAKSKVTGFGNFGGGSTEYFGVGEKNEPESFSRYFSLDAWWEGQIANLPKEIQRTFPFIIEEKAAGSEKTKGIEKNAHPTVKPLSLMMYLIKLGSRENDVVLDPFLGSGTTLLAAHLSNRKGIGIEREAEYVKIAKGRLSSLPNKLHIFDEAKTDEEDPNL